MGVCEGVGSGLHSMNGLPSAGGGLRLREKDGCGCNGGGVCLAVGDVLVVVVAV